MLVNGGGVAALLQIKAQVDRGDVGVHQRKTAAGART